MNIYEMLLSKNNHLHINEKTAMKNKGLYCDDCIWIKKELNTKEKACILAEELGHHHTSAGDILDQRKIGNAQQEHKARVWAYKHLCPIENILFALQDGHRTTWDMADYLNVTEEFLIECLKYYRIYS